MCQRPASRRRHHVAAWPLATTTYTGPGKRVSWQSSQFFKTEKGREGSVELYQVVSAVPLTVSLGVNSMADGRFLFSSSPLLIEREGLHQDGN